MAVGSYTELLERKHDGSVIDILKEDAKVLKNLEVIHVIEVSSTKIAVKVVGL